MCISKKTLRLVSVCSLVLLASCATDMSDVTKNGQTMKSIYGGSFSEGSVAKSSSITPQRKIYEGARDLRKYTRDVEKETKVLFKRISNPTLVGYVFPHLTQDNIPIPAYSIPFRMSPVDYYLMPGEEEVFQ